MTTDGEQRAELEARMRAGMYAEAERVGPPGEFSNRVITIAEETHVRTSGFGRWVFPLAAAACVLVLLGAVPLGYRLVNSGPDVAGNPSLGPTPSVTVTEPTEPPTQSSVGPSPSATPSPTPSGTTSPSDDPAAIPAGFAVLDLTWISDDDGWALGTFTCRHPSGSQCNVLLRTTDGGASWRKVSEPPGAIVHSIRFANENVGYLYSKYETVLYLTTDGGKTWELQPVTAHDKIYGGGYAIEVSNGVAIRLTYGGGAVTLARAAVGSADWKAVGTQNVGSYAPELVRTGHTVAVLYRGHTAGGGNRAYSSMQISSNDGDTWTTRGEPCPQIGSDEIDSTDIASAADGSITVMCRTRGISGRPFVATSRDSGKTFQAAPRGLGDGVNQLAAASAKVLLVRSDAMYRSVDGGATWRKVLIDPTIRNPQSDFQFLGFESDKVGRYVGYDQRSIWTTRDAGATWTQYAFK